MNQRVIADPSQHGWVEVDGKWVWDAESGGGAGAGMVISETEPTDKVEGMQWLNPTTGLVLFWDDEKWLQMPTTGAAGKDGVDGLWTDNGGNSISYDGNVGINANSETPLTIGKAGTTALWEWDLQAGAVDSIRLSAKNPSGGYYAQDALVVDSGGTVTVNGELLAAKSDAGANALAIGFNAGQTGQGFSGVSIGNRAGNTGQGEYGIGVGYQAAKTRQGEAAIGIGRDAGNADQGANSIAIGEKAGETNQGGYNVAVGVLAGSTDQGESAVSIGNGAGKTNQGANSIAIGKQAGLIDQADNGIIINSSGTAVNDSARPNHILLKSKADAHLYYNGIDLWTFLGGTVAAPNITSYGQIIQDGSPVIDAKGLISTLSTLRNATKDETTLEGMRDALADAIGGLIEGLEHQIATMPAPEVGTQEISE
jgi:hypothetical protein